jgi:hypothetical protein
MAKKSIYSDKKIKKIEYSQELISSIYGTDSKFRWEEKTNITICEINYIKPIPIFINNPD